jgi:hypothetical protein
MRFLRLSSLLLLLLAASCSSPYKDLAEQKNASSAMRYKPVYERELYRCVVDGRVLFKKFHLSGVLLFKELDSGTRVVFQNEMGLSFFDFEWDRNDSFRVNQVIPQLDRPAVIKTLQKDIGLLLMKGLDKASETHFQRDGEQYHRFRLDKGYAYYIENSARLMRIINTGERKKVTTISLEGKNTPDTMPEKVTFTHHKANFSIQLTKIAADANE